MQQEQRGVRGAALGDFFTILMDFERKIYVPNDLPHLVGKLTFRSAQIHRRDLRERRDAERREQSRQIMGIAHSTLS